MRTRNLKLTFTFFLGAFMMLVVIVDYLQQVQ